MLFHGAAYAKGMWSVLNVVHYVSFRAMASLLTSLLFSFLFGQWFITFAGRFFRSKARAFTPANHKAKDDMPTMGGVFILLVVLVNCLLWCNLVKAEVWVFLGCLVAFGGIGFWDDWCKINYRRGISSRSKFMLQLAVSCFTMLLLLCTSTQTTVTFPFLKWFNPDIGSIGFVIWGIIVLVGCSNAVNLTDGLDGLAITSLIPNFATFSFICYAAGHYYIAQYLHIPFAGSAEIAVIGATLVGASIGFLWYNTYPAQIFMGDVGALSLGSGLALMALMAKQELLLLISGGLFVVETLSVIIQVFSFKLLGRRLFRMAPIHHHFELLGWQESKITVRFGIISLILCIIALITLKIR